MTLIENKKTSIKLKIKQASNSAFKEFQHLNKKADKHAKHIMKKTVKNVKINQKLFYTT